MTRFGKSCQTLGFLPICLAVVFALETNRLAFSAEPRILYQVLVLDQFANSFFTLFSADRLVRLSRAAVFSRAIDYSTENSFRANAEQIFSTARDGTMLHWPEQAGQRLAPTRASLPEGLKMRWANHLQRRAIWQR